MTSIFLIGYCCLQVISGYSIFGGSRLIMSDVNINQIIKNKYVLSEHTYNSLVNKINTRDVSKIYFTKDLNNAITINNNLDGEVADDYSITSISPLIIKDLTDLSIKNNVETVFLNLPNEIPNHTLQTSDYFFGSAIILSLIGRYINIPKWLNRLNNIRQNYRYKQTQPVITNNATLVTFAGSLEIFQECNEVVQFLKNSTLFAKAGAIMPRGILLNGPPGTGKTLLAKVIANEAKYNFISISASEFVNIFVGAGAANVRKLFKTARDNSPCIIFIDEIDAVGRKRTNNGLNNNEEREQTLNQLLSEMDGFKENDNILVIAATNRKDVLDSALLRPGRFDRIINVPLPDFSSRITILKEYSKNKQLESSVNFEIISELTNGFSGAQLKNLMNEAAIFATRKGDIIITQQNILDAIDKLLVGIIKQTDLRTNDAKKRVARHEIGHAFLAYFFNEYFDFKKASIQSTYNGAGGFTIFNEYNNITESGLYTKDVLFKRMIITMGGKAAEYIYYGENQVSLGANQDLMQANALAQEMINKYGMGNNLEIFYNNDDTNNRNSDKLKEKINNESLALVLNAYNTAKELLIEHKDQINLLINEILNKQILYKTDFVTLNITTNQTI